MKYLIISSWGKRAFKPSFFLYGKYLVERDEKLINKEIIDAFKFIAKDKDIETVAKIEGIQI